MQEDTTNLVAEEWRDIAGFDGKYQVSNMGRVRSRAYGYWRLLRLNRVQKGKVHVALCLNGKMMTRKLHRVVLETFVGPCPDGMEGCHENGDPGDNRLSNLSWGTHSKNQLDKRRHGTAGKLSPDDVRAIRKAVAEGVTQAELAERHGVHNSHISKIVSEKKWRNLE